MSGSNQAGASPSSAPPYFDVLFSRLQQDEPAATIAFGRHVHWGFWEEPSTTDGTPEDYARAAELLCRRVCDAAGVRDGQRILDVGCGFGGTIASLNERFAGLTLVGLNIDPRQLDRAAHTVRPENGNRIEWVQGDAGRLPFPPGVFDVVLAVECIFHFDSRATFFAEAARVLRPAGTIALSDFVPAEQSLPLLKAFNTSADEATRRTYGKIDILCPARSYHELALSAGLALESADDINAHTLPTYPFLRSTMKKWSDSSEARLFDRATAQIEMACRAGMLRYTILRFHKPIAERVGQAA
jgi:ubiquinone/menaquinone biosynthesis C-methylase UbiE